MEVRIKVEVGLVLGVEISEGVKGRLRWAEGVKWDDPRDGGKGQRKDKDEGKGMWNVKKGNAGAYQRRCKKSGQLRGGSGATKKQGQTKDRTNLRARIKRQNPDHKSTASTIPNQTTIITIQKTQTDKNKV